MSVIEIYEANRWPKWTNEMLIVEGTDDPVFVRPVLYANDGVRSHWVDLRIGALDYSGAKYSDYAPAYAEDKTKELRADAERAEHSGGTVQFVIHLRKTSRRTTLTPAEARQVAHAIDEALRLLANLPVEKQPTAGGSAPDASGELNTILYGPPGTGKTWHTVTRAVAIVENRGVVEVAQEDRAAVKRRFDEHRRAGRIEMVTFHQNTTYEDFVEGIRPVLTDSASAGVETPAEREGVGDVQYELSRGVFRRIAERAEADPDGRYVLVIDEINRGNVARIFGELITLIEDSKRVGRDDEARVTLPGSKTDFGVPENLHVVGTMNTADRSIALLDTALRRRFVFEEMMPDPFHSGIREDVDGVDCRELLAAMNRRIAVLLDREHQIGHTYFLGVDTPAELAATFQTRVVPLLQEYFYDDWEKIRAVLNRNSSSGSRIRRRSWSGWIWWMPTGPCTSCCLLRTTAGPPRRSTGRSTRRRRRRKTATRRRATDHAGRDRARPAGRPP